MTFLAVAEDGLWRLHYRPVELSNVDLVLPLGDKCLQLVHLCQDLGLVRNLVCLTLHLVRACYGSLPTILACLDLDIDSIIFLRVSCFVLSHLAVVFSCLNFDEILIAYASLVHSLNHDFWGVDTRIHHLSVVVGCSSSALARELAIDLAHGL